MGNGSAQSIADSVEDLSTAAQQLVLHRLELLLVEIQETARELLLGGALGLAGVLVAVGGWAALVAAVVVHLHAGAGPAGLLAAAGGLHLLLGLALAGLAAARLGRSRRRHTTSPPEREPGAPPEGRRGGA